MADDFDTKSIRDRLLSNSILEPYDRRQGSIIYNTIAPVCEELSTFYGLLDYLSTQVNLNTASMGYLDEKANDYGLTRIQASPAVIRGEFLTYKYNDSTGEREKDENGEYILIPLNIPDGSRFTVINNSEITYIYRQKYNEFEKVLVCEQVGIKGNLVDKTLLPLTPINSLVKAHIPNNSNVIIVSGEETETDSSLRQRCFDYLQVQAFGGNIADYTAKLIKIEGIGEGVKVFPTPNNRAGYVLLSCLDGEYKPINSEEIEKVENIFNGSDSGNGLGLAPIGHVVQVTTPEYVNIGINMVIYIDSVTDTQIIEPLIVDKIKQYFDKEIKTFGTVTNMKYKDITLRILPIISSIIDDVNGVKGVLNITNESFNVVDNKNGQINVSENRQTIIIKDDENHQYLPEFYIDDSNITIAVEGA